MKQITKNPFYHIIGSAVGVLIAQLLSEKAGQPIIGWFIGGTVLTLSAQLFMSSTKRSPLQIAPYSLLGGVVISALIALVHAFLPE